MSLYFVRHQHSPEACPAKDPSMGQMLLEHLTRVNARKFGVDLRGPGAIDAASEFCGYDTLEGEGRVLKILKGGVEAASASAGSAATAVKRHT